MTHDHRPWPMPQKPWVMEQVWHDLLFIHWPVTLESLRRAVPSALSIDTYEGQAWIAVVPFRMTGVRLRRFPALPYLSAFPELNVRTYVTHGNKPGVYFFSLEAGNPLAALIARVWFHLPYYWADMKLTEDDGKVLHYESRRHWDRESSVRFAGAYKPVGRVFQAKSGELAHWLIERYCLYEARKNGDVMRAEIHHPPWALQSATLQLEENSMTKPLNIDLSTAPPLLHFARRQDVCIWSPESA